MKEKTIPVSCRLTESQLNGASRIQGETGLKASQILRALVSIGLAAATPELILAHAGVDLENAKKELEALNQRRECLTQLLSIKGTDHE